MIFLADNIDSWRSQDGHYQIKHIEGGFGTSAFRVLHQGGLMGYALTMDKALEMCRNHAKVPELDFMLTDNTDGR